jgi:SanA protein
MHILMAVLAIFILLVLLSIVVCYNWVKLVASGKCYDTISMLPPKEYALVMGTAKWVSYRNLNLYYQYRIAAATSLYEAGKVKKLIVSGAAFPGKYNQATEMRNTLIEKGVPSENIISDEAGYRTLDSMVRCKNIFLQDDIVVVSQHFHNERAVFIGNFKKIKTIAFNAQDVRGKAHLRMILRESLARVKCVLDIFILHTLPVKNKIA